MGISKQLVTDALARTGLDGYDDLVGTGILQWVAACDDYASIKLHAKGASRADLERIATGANDAVRSAAARSDERVASLTVMFVDDAGAMVHSVRFTDDAPAASAGQQAASQPKAGAPAAEQPSPQDGHRPIGGLSDAANPFGAIKHIIAVGAGKGGVGKSTVSTNLAVALARQGHAVGLMDGDIYGPSLPTMLGLASLEPQTHKGKIQPFLVHGIKAVTIGKLVDPEKPLIWRGPMAHGAFKQLAEQSDWGELDYLIIDLPPGTGDVPLTMAQNLQLTGAVIVCTPQQVAQDDALRATRMFQQLNVEILGVVENMSEFIAPDGNRYDIFGRGGAEMMAQRLGLPFLGALPITMSLRVNSDAGDPTANFDESPLADSLNRLATNLVGQANLVAMRLGRSSPSLTIR